MERDPKGLGEYVLAAATDVRKIIDWTTTVHAAACMGEDGHVLQTPVALRLNGGPDLHTGNHVVLHSIQ
ncbi:hypothetical protein AQ914_18245 [Burkholderia pseudomallei]|nr:hypothetical protein AQ914_18245 [Burkholderia pseudomallei]